MRLVNAAHAAHSGIHGMSILCPQEPAVDLGDADCGTEFRSNAWAGF